MGVKIGNGENAGYMHFLFFPQCFQTAFFSGVAYSCDCVLRVKYFLSLSSHLRLCS